MTMFRRDPFGFKALADESAAAAGPSPRQAAREALERLFKRRQEQDGAGRRGCPPLAGLSSEAIALVSLLMRDPDEVGFVDELRARFEASECATADEFDRAFAELGRHGLAEVGPFIDEDGGPASRGIARLRRDVDLPGTEGWA